MSYQSQDTAGRDQGFRTQVRQAVLAQAAVVSAESGSTTNHTNRSAYASAIVRYIPEEQLSQWAWAVAGDGVTTVGATDAAILARVATLWNLFSGGL